MGWSRVRRPVIVGLVLAGVVLGACTRSASTPPATTEPALTPGEENWQQATMDAVRQAVMQTQTAQAGPVTSVPPTDTPETPVPPTETLAEVTEATSPEPTEASSPEPTSAGTGGRPASYVLQEGEFPYCIARRFNVNPAELLDLNGLGTGTVVPPGTSLRIPQTDNTFPGDRSLHTHPSTFTVRTGDTVYSVACYFGDVDPLAIAARNNLSPPYNLTPGSTINIP
jgi:LysM repeat protein